MDQPARRSDSPSASTRRTKRHENDRVKTALMIAAAFASGLVFVVAAKSLFLNVEQDKSQAQATQR